MPNEETETEDRRLISSNRMQKPNIRLMQNETRQKKNSDWLLSSLD